MALCGCTAIERVQLIDVDLNDVAECVACVRSGDHVEASDT